MVRDKIGQEIKTGCLIAYGHALGNCAGLRIGKVLKVETEPRPYWRDYGPETVYTITVRGTEDGWRDEGPCLTSKNGFLRFPDRIVVLDPEKVDSDFRAILDPLPLE